MKKFIYMDSEVSAVKLVDILPPAGEPLATAAQLAAVVTTVLGIAGLAAALAQVF